MKFKLFLLLPFIVCGYGLLPVSYHFDKTALHHPNNLLIKHQECGCPCPNAYIKEGQIIIPEDLQRKYSTIHKQEINLTGRDPFKPYDPELATQDIIVTGKVVGMDTVLCDQSGCEVVPVFKVDKWSVGIYYPRLYTHGRIFLIFFLICSLLSAVITIIFIGKVIKRAVIRKDRSR